MACVMLLVSCPCYCPAVWLCCCWTTAVYKLALRQWDDKTLEHVCQTWNQCVGKHVSRCLNVFQVITLDCPTYHDCSNDKQNFTTFPSCQSPCGTIGWCHKAYFVIGGAARNLSHHTLYHSGLLIHTCSQWSLLSLPVQTLLLLIFSSSIVLYSSRQININTVLAIISFTISEAWSFRKWLPLS